MMQTTDKLKDLNPEDFIKNTEGNYSSGPEPVYSLKGTMPNANQCCNSYIPEIAKSKINRLMIRNEQALKYLTTIRNMLPHELSFDQEEAMGWLLETKLSK